MLYPLSYEGGGMEYATVRGGSHGWRDLGLRTGGDGTGERLAQAP